jgi:tRNA nucleotidyltransferase (CCA-adding enzyme)
LQAIGVLARDMGQTAYLVGGMVRDLALGCRNIDLDIVVEGDALGLAGAFARATGSSVKGRTKFGTCKIESRAFGAIDLATARSESYRYPGALPDVEASNLKADLARRDFTVNAMAISLDPRRYGRLLDPFGGSVDISRGRLRILHAASFRDDPTRIFRGVRFAARFGFTFESRTLGRLKACLREGCIGSVSGKRIYTELKLICMEDEARRAFRLLGKYRIPESIDPVLGRQAIRSRHMKRLASAIARVDISAGEAFGEKWLCRVAGLFFGLKRREAARLADRLDLPGRVKETCLWVSTELPGTRAKLSRLDAGSAYRVVKLLRRVTPEGIAHLFASSGGRERNLIAAYLKTWRGVSPSLNGRRVVALGIEKGPLVGRVLERLLELRLQGKLTSPEDEIAYIRRRVRLRR